MENLQAGSQWFSEIGLRPDHPRATALFRSNGKRAQDRVGRYRERIFVVVVLSLEIRRCAAKMSMEKCVLQASDSALFRHIRRQVRQKNLFSLTEVCFERRISRLQHMAVKTRRLPSIMPVAHVE